MKTRHFLWGAIGLLAMASCSKDEVVSVQKDEIGYGVAVNSLTRAANSYCNETLPPDFKVWAKTTSDNKLYIKGDKIENIDGNWIDKTATRYWPANGTLDFYAQRNGDLYFDFNDGAPKFNNFAVNENVIHQVDLVYAVHKNQAKTDKVQLNFRHALSQVCFWATNHMKGAEVTINSVSVGHLANTGTFTFPTTNTDTNYENWHTDSTGQPDPTSELNGGTWEIPEDTPYNTTYTVKPLEDWGSDGTTVPAILEPNMRPNTIIDLTGPNDEHARGFSQVLTLLPQKVSAWDPETKGANATDWNGAYFLLDLEIHNVAGSSLDGEKVKTLIYDGEVAIPATIDWKPGYRYIYTFVFNEGSNGGYTPNPQDPQPILASIEYKVTADDYISAHGDGDDDTIIETKKYSTTVKLHSNYIDYTDANDCYDENAVEYVEEIQINSYTTSYSIIPEYKPTNDTSSFTGWATTPDATSAVYNYANPTIPIDMTQATLDLYAVWSYSNYCWRFHSNGGTGEMPAGWSTVKNGNYWGPGKTEERQIPNLCPVREGYKFTGWKILSKNGLSEVIYQPEEFIRLDPDDPVLHFYAQWEEEVPEGGSGGLDEGETDAEF